MKRFGKRLAMTRSTSWGLRSASHTLFLPTASPNQPNSHQWIVQSSTVRRHVSWSCGQLRARRCRTSRHRQSSPPKPAHNQRDRLTAICRHRSSKPLSTSPLSTGQSSAPTLTARTTPAAPSNRKAKESYPRYLYFTPDPFLDPVSYTAHQLHQVYNEVLAAAANASASDPNNNATITPWDVKSLAVGLLSGQPVFPDFFTLLSAAVSGNSSALSAATSSSSSGPPLGAIIAIPYLCTDTAIQNNTFANFHDALTTSGAHDIYNLTQSSSLQLKLFCSAWPFPTTPLQPLNLTDPNMLIVTADFDVDTPMEKAVKVWQTQATNSTLVVRHGDDHVSFNLPEVDSTGLTKTFLNTGILPCARDEVLLSVYPPGSAGPGGPRDPYSVPTGLLAGDCPDDAAGCNLS